MTQMAEALQQAGIKTARERLKEIALKTVISHPGSSRQVVEQEIWQTIRKSPACQTTAARSNTTAGRSR